MGSDKVLFLITLAIPKALVAILTWIAGAFYLAHAQDMENLITKGLVLQFIPLIDDSIFDCLMPHSKKDRIVRSEVVHWRGALTRLWSQWQGEAIKLSVSVVLTV